MYKNGKIYALRTHHSNKIYIGSTTTELNERFKSHKKKSNKAYSKILFEKYDDVYIELIELFSCETKKDLHRREGEIIKENFENCVNERIAGQTQKEWVIEYRIKNKDILAEKAKQYNIEHQAERKEQQKQYVMKNKDSIRKRRIARYNNTDREERLKTQQEWTEKNRDYVNAKQRENYAKRQAKKLVICAVGFP
jgi:hypothetical protein